MSYMRGNYYTYEGDGYLYMFNLGEVPVSVVDEFVVMRWCKLSEKQRMEAMERATTKYSGNFGCEKLCVSQKEKGVLHWMAFYSVVIMLESYGLSSEEVESALVDYRDRFWDMDVEQIKK